MSLKMPRVIRIHKSKKDRQHNDYFLQETIEVNVLFVWNYYSFYEIKVIDPISIKYSMAVYNHVKEKLEDVKWVIRSCT